jgi:hypothetical protein
VVCRSKPVGAYCSVTNGKNVIRDKIKKNNSKLSLRTRQVISLDFFLFLYSARALSVSLSFPSSVRSYCLRLCVFRRLLLHVSSPNINSARPPIRRLPLLQSIVVTANEPSPFPVMQSDPFVARHTN